MKKPSPPAPGDPATWPDEFGKAARGWLAETLVFGVALADADKAPKPDYARVCTTEAEVKEKRKGYWLPLCLVKKVSDVK